MTRETHTILSRRFRDRERDLTKDWVLWHKYYDRKEMRIVSGPYKDRKGLMAKLCAKTGVQYFQYHVLRHSGASLLENLNVPIVTIQRILGHENRTTTEIYLHIMEGSERLAINALEVGLFSKSPTQSPAIKKTELLIVFSNSVIFLVGQQGIEP
jgi:integrase